MSLTEVTLKNFDQRFLNFHRERAEKKREKPITIQLDHERIKHVRDQLAVINPNIRKLSNSYTVEFVLELFEVMIKDRIPSYVPSLEGLRLKRISKSQAMKRAAETRRINKADRDLAKKNNFVGVQ